ncbi:MAG: Molybdopterin-synthase adenylyltransferase [uncultured Solirubrobacteraceae bacterium]|uniref:Molybdopterin-synthase adenylyltransferase n=1 Tax=uncultured Solirubrobacteraceae bacterium TaxID=1162706 RepID=A0A6J4T5I3_9ACTN|nr:MAG: Molybdopterin-synthase adenylyltransferase [uncultured Solirubrobacteraceae bacterium]
MHLVTTSGRIATTTRFALRETVEAFTAADGNVYVLRGGTDAEFVIEDPSPLDRALVELLHSPATLDELCNTLRRRGHETEPGALALIIEQLDELDLVSEFPVRYVGLSAEDRSRYDRQLVYFDDLIGVGAPAVEAQRRLLSATVTIVGVGALGSWTAAGLACAGVGRLVLIDDDTVELSNLNRQLLYRRCDVGRPKVDAAADALAAFNPGIEIVRMHRRIDGADDVARVAAGSDLVVGTADHPPHEIARWLNRGCVAAGVPHVTASQFAPMVKVGPLFRPGVTGCLACAERSARDRYPDYDALVAYRQGRPIAGATLGPPSALIGAIISMDAVHLITGAATPSTQGRSLMFDVRDLSMRVEDVAQDDGCEVCSPRAA